MQKQINIGVGVIGGALSFLFGGFDTALKLLCTMVVFDYVSGVCAAAYTGTLSSRVGFVGIGKKCCMFVVVAAANLLSQFSGVPIREITIFFYLSNEGLSFVENMGKILPIPPQLKQLIESLKEEEHV